MTVTVREVNAAAKKCLDLAGSANPKVIKSVTDVAANTLAIACGALHAFQTTVSEANSKSETESAKYLKNGNFQRIHDGTKVEEASTFDLFSMMNISTTQSCPIIIKKRTRPL